MLDILQEVLRLRDVYVGRGYTPYLVFMGDVFDRDIQDADGAMRSVDLFRYLATEFADMYTVLGNHEQTYIRNNPFWYLVSKIEDTVLLSVKKALQPKSVKSCLRVPDIIVDGEVTFYFNHYGVPPKTPTKSGVAVGLFHQNVGSNDICKMWGTFDNVEEASYVQAYSYCFFGHMHLAYGRYYLNESETCVCEWLGSCGRTSILEVETAPLDVNIPAILIEDGKFIAIESNKFVRQSATECVDYTKVDLIRSNNAKLEAVKANIPSGVRGNTLLESVRMACDVAGMAGLLKLVNGSYDLLMATYRADLMQFTEINQDIAEPNSVKEAESVDEVIVEFGVDGNLPR